jgi:hypothetical protein
MLIGIPALILIILSKKEFITGRAVHRANTSEGSQKLNAKRPWKTTVAGMLDIAGAISLFTAGLGLLLGMQEENNGEIWVLLFEGAFTILLFSSGISSLKRTHWWLAVLGSSNPIGIPALILILLSKKEFTHSEQKTGNATAKP